MHLPLRFSNWRGDSLFSLTLLFLALLFGPGLTAQDDCASEGGAITLDDYSTETTICADDEEDPLTVTFVARASGENQTFVITDAASGEILGIPNHNGPFVLDGAGAGVCRIYHLSYDEDLTGLAMGGNLNDLSGCFDLSNFITVTRNTGADCPQVCEVEGGAIRLADFSFSATICADGQPDPLTVAFLAKPTGDNQTFVITNAATGEILGIPDSNGPFNLDGAGEGVCRIYHLSYEDGLTGLTVGGNIVALNGCFDLSNFISVTRNVGEDCPPPPCELDAGAITLDSYATEATICADGEPDPLSVLFVASPDAGNQTFVITNAETGEILGIPGSGMTFDLDGAGPGTCLIYHLVSEDGLTGLSMGANINGLQGCFDLSNPITVTRLAGDDCDAICEQEGGAITLADFTTRTAICSDGMADPLSVVFVGAAAGDNQTFVITDANTGTILGIPDHNGPFDLDGAGEGICRIYHLSYRDGLTGLMMDGNLSDLDGCFDLSNPITVDRFGGDCVPECLVRGGMISLPDGSTAMTICVDDMADPIRVVRDGGAAGSRRTFVITDAATGSILSIPDNNGPFDLNGAGGGACNIYYLGYEAEVTGLIVGGNIEALEGCFSLSNSITVTRIEPVPGAISLMGGSTATTICVDDVADPLTVVLDGAADAANLTFVITDAATGTILGVPDNNGPFDLNGAGRGVCNIYYLAYEDGLTGLSMGSNLADLDGCFNLSNAISVTRNLPDGGAITLDDFSTEATICADSTPDPLEVVLVAPPVGGRTTFVITDASSGEILGIPAGSGPFDLDGAGEGVCNIYHLAYEEGLTGLSEGANINDLAGCFDLSNAITVTRNVGDDCQTVCEVDGGAITLSDFSTSATICADGEPDPLAVRFVAQPVGSNQAFVITDANSGEILALPDHNGPFDLDGAGEGICNIYHLAYEDGLSGLAGGANINDLSGCFSLSNPIQVTRNAGEDCVAACEVDGGAITFRDFSTAKVICADGEPDPLAVRFVAPSSGTIRTFVITDAATGTILGIPDNAGPFDLDGAGEGVCLIYHLAYQDDLAGLEVDANINDLNGCFDLSNALTVTRNTGDNCSDNLQSGSAANDVSLLRSSDFGPSTTLNLFPNPATSLLNVEVHGMTGERSTLEIFDLSGRRVLETTLAAPNGRTQLQLPELPSGTYLLRVVNDEQVVTRRLSVRGR